MDRGNGATRREGERQRERELQRDMCREEEHKRKTEVQHKEGKNQRQGTKTQGNEEYHIYGQEDSNGQSVGPAKKVSSGKPKQIILCDHMGREGNE